VLGGPLREAGDDPLAALDSLAHGADRGIVATAGPRYFGFVVGGSLPAALAADWLVSAWDQNAALNVLSPACAAIEEIAQGWILDLLGLPEAASIGFVTGGLAANFTCLLAARHKVLQDAGWDVEERGLPGAPEVRIFAGAQVHVSVRAALRMAGFGTASLTLVEADGEGRMVPAALAEALAASAPGPRIVFAQAGEVNTGAFDPLAEIEPISICGWNTTTDDIDRSARAILEAAR
jgi:glutamate/tyrosine decarboxylase-like PLP-dependent enzyme